MGTEALQCSSYNYGLGKLQHITSYSFSYRKSLTVISSKHKTPQFLIYQVELANNWHFNYSYFTNLCPS